jgi:microcystin-dependent protein
MSDQINVNMSPQTSIQVSMAPACIIVEGTSGGGGGGDTIPPGLVSPFAGSSAPTGWLACNGATVSRTTYANLFSAIGTTYGAGDGSTTFGLPNLQGAFPLGSSGSYALGATGGEATHLLTIAEVPAHTHTYSQPSIGGGAEGTGSNASLPVVTPGQATGSTGGGGAHNNMPPYLAVNYIIKT